MNTTNPHPCAEIEPLLSDFVDGHLDPAGAAAVASHAQACPRCRSIVEDLRGLARQLGQQPLLEPPPRLHAAIAERARAEGLLKTPHRGLRLPVPAWAAAAVLICLLAGLPLLVWRWTRPPDAVGPPSIASILKDLQSAQDLYRSSLSRLEVLARQRTTRMPRTTQIIFENNLALIDRTIMESETYLSQHARSQAAWEQVLAVYQKKIEFLRLFIEAGTT